jgi:2-phospho-L-lactate/phosphoenolpyruvate guanylyltransferase
VTGRDVWAVVLVKPFRLAKQRLSSVLDVSERSELARVMLEDVLTAVDACERLAGVIVVTADRAAAAVARRHEAIVLMETAANGMNAAVTRVVKYLTGSLEAGMVVVPSDLPHVSAADIEEMIDLIDRTPAIALVRSSDGGTNLLACRPSRAIAPSFGPDSFNAHCEAARRKGITPTVCFAPHLSLDIDRRDDLAAFVSRGSLTRTHDYLSSLNIQARLSSPTTLSLVRAGREMTTHD